MAPRNLQIVVSHECSQIFEAGIFLLLGSLFLRILNVPDVWHVILWIILLALSILSDSLAYQENAIPLSTVLVRLLLCEGIVRLLRFITEHLDESGLLKFQGDYRYFQKEWLGDSPVVLNDLPSVLILGALSCIGLIALGRELINVFRLAKRLGVEVLRCI